MKTSFALQQSITPSTIQRIKSGEKVIIYNPELLNETAVIVRKKNKTAISFDANPASSSPVAQALTQGEKPNIIFSISNEDFDWIPEEDLLTFLYMLEYHQEKFANKDTLELFIEKLRVLNVAYTSVEDIFREIDSFSENDFSEFLKTDDTLEYYRSHVSN